MKFSGNNAEEDFKDGEGLGLKFLERFLMVEAMVISVFDLFGLYSVTCEFK